MTLLHSIIGKKRQKNVTNSKWEKSAVLLMVMVFAALYGSAQAFAQDSADDPTQAQMMFCKQHDVYPCTEANIMAKQRLLNYPDSYADPPPSGLNGWIVGSIVIFLIMAIVVVFIAAVKKKK